MIAFRTSVADIAAPLPGATLDDPWGGGHDAWKVGGKIFACIGAVSPGVAVKCPDIETAQMLIEVGAAARVRYFHRSWVLLPETAAKDDLRHRIHTSYRLVRAGLPASLRRALPNPEET